MTTPTGKPRGRPKGSPKTGGRVAKSLDRSERMLVTSQMAGDILSVYARLGGEDFLFRWAKKNETAFVTNVLQKLMPAAPKDDPDFVQNNQFNVGNLSEFEAARRVAFVLSAGLHAQQELAPVAECVPGTPEMTPQEACEVSDWQPPTYMPEPPEPVTDPAHERWIAEIPLTPEERRNAALVRETQEVTISSYRGGSPAEQGGGYQQPVVNTKASAGELARRLNRRGRDLL